MAILQGKSVRRQAPPPSRLITTSLPSFILENHKDVTLCIDFFFVQGVCFLHTISQKIHFRTAVRVPNRFKSTYLPELRRVLQRYPKRDFNIVEVKADLEFCCLEDHLNPITLDLCAADDHNGGIKNSNKVVKADLRTLLHGLPFQKVPKLLLSEAVRFVILSRNQFPATDGISDTLSPLSIVTGKGVPDF